MKAKEILQINKIIPVIHIQSVDEALKLAQALLAGGVQILEITLRSKAAFKAIEAVKKNFPQAVVGAGTIINSEQIKKAQDCGAEFIIAPGLNENFIKKAEKIVKVPFIPGVANAGQIMLALEYGLSELKFFPAEAIGGVQLLKSFEAVFAGVKFCPTGGISMQNASSYLELSNVLCVGASWLAPKELILKESWKEITKLAEQSLKF